MNDKNRCTYVSFVYASQQRQVLFQVERLHAILRVIYNDAVCFCDRQMTQVSRVILTAAQPL